MREEFFGVICLSGIYMFLMMGWDGMGVLRFRDILRTVCMYISNKECLKQSNVQRFDTGPINSHLHSCLITVFLRVGGWIW